LKTFLTLTVKTIKIVIFKNKNSSFLSGTVCISTYRLNCLRQGDEHCAYTPLDVGIAVYLCLEATPGEGNRNARYTGRAKKYPLKNLANFSITTKRYDIKVYTLASHSVIHKYGKFHYIIYRIEKTALLLVMAT